MKTYINISILEVGIHHTKKHEQRNDVEPRRSKRARTNTSFGTDFITFLTEVEPQTYKEAMSTPGAPYWQEVVNDEINSIMQNHT